MNEINKPPTNNISGDRLLPICTKDNFMRNKTCNYKLISLLMLYSNWNAKEEERYIYRNKLSEYKEEIETLSGTKLKSIFNGCKKLSDMKNTPISAFTTHDDKIVYKIETGEIGEFVSIEVDILKQLISSCSSATIKLYCLLKWMCRNSEKHITRSWIAKQIGITDSKKGYDTISKCTEELVSLGLINKRQITSGNGKYKVYYSVNTYEEFKALSTPPQDDQLDKKEWTLESARADYNKSRMNCKNCKFSQLHDNVASMDYYCLVKQEYFSHHSKCKYFTHK